MSLYFVGTLAFIGVSEGTYPIGHTPMSKIMCYIYRPL